MHLIEDDYEILLDFDFYILLVDVKKAIDDYIKGRREYLEIKTQHPSHIYD